MNKTLGSNQSENCNYTNPFDAPDPFKQCRPNQEHNPVDYNQKIFADQQTSPSSSERPLVDSLPEESDGPLTSWSKRKDDQVIYTDSNDRDSDSNCISGESLLPETHF